MAATKQDISRWFDEGVEMNATHMLIICDTYDWGDFPLYVEQGQDARAVALANDGPNMQRLMAVYSLSQPKEEQLQDRVFNY